MKIESVSLHNFKLFDEYSVSLKNQTLNEVNDRFMLLGDNGSGKTTLLHAIAFTLWRAMSRTKDVNQFDWVGFSLSVLAHTTGK